MFEGNNSLNDPSPYWGGNWTKQKLDAFISYVKAYLTIMKKNPYWKTIYFDGFAGSGDLLRRKNQEQTILNISFDQEALEDIDLYKGSVKRILQLKDYTFDFYYFIDSNFENVNRINSIKNEIDHIDHKRIIVRKTDCNSQFSNLAKALKSKQYAALLFVDPFGMQVNWKSIESLRNTRSDIWILIPSGVSVNRLLPKSGKVKSKNKLEKFFGLPFDELYKLFYSDKKIDTLFGKVRSIEKLENPIERVAEIYQKQLQTVWKHVTSEPLVLRNSKNVSIFHFLFASNNQNAMKIASQIIKKKQK